MAQRDNTAHRALALLWANLGSIPGTTFVPLNPSEGMYKARRNLHTPGCSTKKNKTKKGDTLGLYYKPIFSLEYISHLQLFPCLLFLLWRNPCSLLTIYFPFISPLTSFLSKNFCSIKTTLLHLKKNWLYQEDTNCINSWGNSIDQISLFCVKAISPHTLSLCFYILDKQYPRLKSFDSSYEIYGKVIEKKHCLSSLTRRQQQPWRKRLNHPGSLCLAWGRLQEKAERTHRKWLPGVSVAEQKMEKLGPAGPRVDGDR